MIGKMVSLVVRCLFKARYLLALYAIYAGCRSSVRRMRSSIYNVLGLKFHTPNHVHTGARCYVFIVLIARDGRYYTLSPSLGFMCTSRHMELGIKRLLNRLFVVYGYRGKVNHVHSGIAFKMKSGEWQYKYPSGIPNLHRLPSIDDPTLYKDIDAVLDFAVNNPITAEVAGWEECTPATLTGCIKRIIGR